jgi:hypothetical protein
VSNHFLGLSGVNYTPLGQSFGLGPMGSPAPPKPTKPAKKATVCVPGYWGRDLRCRIGQEATQQKIAALLNDELLSTGVRVYLWLPVHEYVKALAPVNQTGGDTPTPGSLKCSCVKESGQHADKRCNSCHGTDFIPGYLKFGYQTIWMASISPGWTVSNLELNTVLKPYRYQLISTAVVGSLESPDLFFTKSVSKGLWDFRNDYVLRDATNSSVTVFFSTDQGLTWYDISNLSTKNPPYGAIRFRVNLSRTSTAVSSPAWEMLRVRYPTIAEDGRNGPWITILKNVMTKTDSQADYGLMEEGVLRWWTAPLSLFDCNIAAQTSIDDPINIFSLIKEPAFVEFIESVRIGQRWSVTRLNYSDSLDFLTRQFFDSRLQQSLEATSLVW